MKPLASLNALITASVPDDTIRTFSTDGINSTIFSASSVSFFVGAPKLVPFSTALITASLTSLSQWPKIIGPHEHT